jgi:hypothetical protein
MFRYTLGWSGFGRKSVLDRGIRLRAAVVLYAATISTIIPLFHTFSHRLYDFK